MEGKRGDTSMLNWEVQFHYKDNCYHVMADNETSNYYFSSHAIDRLLERNNNINSIVDIGKPVKRVVKCLNNWKVDAWVMEHAFGTKLIIHDVDISMMYIVVCKCNRYEIVSAYNEYKRKYKNTHSTPELWVSINKQQGGRRNED